MAYEAWGELFDPFIRRQRYRDAQKQQGLENTQRADVLAYQKQRDTVGDEQWNAQQKRLNEDPMRRYLESLPAQDQALLHDTIQNKYGGDITKLQDAIADLARGKAATGTVTRPMAGFELPSGPAGPGMNGIGLTPPVNPFDSPFQKLVMGGMLDETGELRGPIAQGAPEQFNPFSAAMKAPPTKTLDTGSVAPYYVATKADREMEKQNNYNILQQNKIDAGATKDQNTLRGKARGQMQDIKSLYKAGSYLDLVANPANKGQLFADWQRYNQLGYDAFDNFTPEPFETWTASLGPQATAKLGLTNAQAAAIPVRLKLLQDKLVQDDRQFSAQQKSIESRFTRSQAGVNTRFATSQAGLNARAAAGKSGKTPPFGGYIAAEKMAVDAAKQGIADLKYITDDAEYTKAENAAKAAYKTAKTAYQAKANAYTKTYFGVGGSPAAGGGGSRAAFKTNGPVQTIGAAVAANPSITWNAFWTKVQKHHPQWSKQATYDAYRNAKGSQ